MMKKAYEAALVGSAAALGYNWIYNMPYLEKLADEGDLLFEKPMKDVYERARKAYFAYPFATVGDVSVQGEILKWLHQALNRNDAFNRGDYENLVFEKLKPGGAYRGWVESYAMKLIYNRLNDALKTGRDPLAIDDTQMVGFMPYIACKAHGLSTDKAWDLAQAFTLTAVFSNLYAFFDGLYEALEDGDKDTVLKTHAARAPEAFRDKFTRALDTDTKAFIGTHVKTSCDIAHALPLIYHIIAQTDSFTEALRINTRIGGASMDRGLMLGYVLSAIYEVPSTLRDKVNVAPS